jgi:sugar/nucleoside kinase (ribokinase family)
MSIIGAGLITVDIVQLCNSRWQPQSIAPFYTSGGTVSNILSYLSAFGHDCSIAGIIGQDEVGTVLREDLRIFGVNTEHLVSQEDVSTRRIGHLISGEGRNRGMHKFVLRCLNCRQHFPKTPFASLRDVNGVGDKIGTETLLVIDRANRLTIELARRTASKKGLVLFEPGHLPTQNNVVGKLMAHVDILKYSQDLKWKENGFDEMFVKNSRLKLLVETRGAEGVKVVLPQRNREMRLSTTYKIRDMRILDSSGAGDAFTAGLLLNLGTDSLRYVDELDNERLEEAMNYGQAMGALACRFLGSKGLLYARSKVEIRKAVESITKLRKLPTGFAETVRVVNRKRLKRSRANICKICRLDVIKGET